MKRCSLIGALVIVMVASLSAGSPPPGIIVRDRLGISHLAAICPFIGCNVVRALGDPQGQVFLINSLGITQLNLLQLLQSQLGIVSAELDQVVSLRSASVTSLPSGLYDQEPVNYYGTAVWDGYINQPANLIVRTQQARSQFQVFGSSIVALIDTGLDPQHPALAPVVLPGYDFTRNVSGADEKADLDHSTAAVLDNGGGGIPLYVSPTLAAMLPPMAAAALGDPRYAGFGHGTMTAGIVHMVAPTAQILPLKAFSVDGTGNLSDVVRAVYYAATQGSKIISMSFNFYGYSAEMANAISYVTSRGIICVASAGNDGQEIVVYPASMTNVIGVASTSDFDTRSSFSNYGPQVVWVAAPGENIISAYPYGTYAASSGTSFSAPFVSGAAALLANLTSNLNQASAAAAIAHARYISSDLNNGRLDTSLALGSITH